MTPRSKFLHLRQAFLLTALFLTLTLSGWSDSTAPTNAPDSTQVAPTPGKVPPSPAASPLKSDGTPDAAPIDLPPFKPIPIHAERDSDIGREVGNLLEQNHYLQKPISSEMSQRWLTNYFQELDPTHLFFLQSDVDEFTAKYGNNLGDLLLNGSSDDAGIDPAFEIFNRYMERVQEDVALAEKLLHQKFDFTKDETFTIRNNKSPWIKDEAASDAIWHGQVKSDLLNGLLDKKSPADTISSLSKRYVSFLRDGEEDEDMDVLAAYLNALANAYDPHSDYMDPEEAQDFNIQAINHSVKGIGAVLKSDGGYATIEEVIPGGPADLDKRLQPNDRILAVGQGTDKPVDAVYMKLKHVVAMIRGPKGSMVHLVVHPASAKDESAQEDLMIKRDEVSIKDSLASAHIIEHRLPGGAIEKIGVIDLHDFYDNTSADVAKLIQRLKKENVTGIILDFRNNGGGLLDQAVDLTGLFVKREPVVQIRRSDGAIDQLPPEDTRQIYDGPLLVMVNKMSASATEIVAAALQDYGRAIIVGDQSTHGKGTVQTLVPLDERMPIGFPTEPGAGDLKITVQKFYRVAGGSTQQKGVVPDIVLPSMLDAYDSILGETSLPYYLPYDTVPAVPFDYLNLTAPYLPALKVNSAARVAASPDFGYLRQDVAFVKKKFEDSIVSLNEATRLKEQADLKTLEAQRKKDLLARKSGRDEMLNLTLDMVDQNLPAALPDEKKTKVEAADADTGSDDEAVLDSDSAINNPTDDPQLDEAVNIMSDYTRMLHDSGSALVQSSPVPPAK
ncbi:MAG TPA: carboxy terminal-processing peptidase [Candidatus Methylacidiphilales bacterium]|jgi:carboxyl-terminal processing protease|nr:carboxy terminal-processing peptidase [Candidatus Methylacidiphilales bacterium]